MQVERRMPSSPATGAEIIARYKEARRRLRGARPCVQLPKDSSSASESAPEKHLDFAEPTPMPAKKPKYTWLNCIEPIIFATCTVSAIERHILLSQRRTKDIVYWRMIAMYVAKISTGASLPEIGRRFGDRDHTTVLSAVRSIVARAIEREPLALDIVAVLDVLKTVQS